MDSINTLMDIVEKKDQFIKDVIRGQTIYQVQLDENIEDTINEIQESFETLLNEVEYRKKQMVDAADTIYKLKKIASLNRIETLKNISVELDECVDLYYNGSKEDNTKQLDKIRSIIDKVDCQNHEFTNDVLLAWSCNGYQLRGMIKQYGVIDVRKHIGEAGSENDSYSASQSQSSESNDESVFSKEDYKEIIEKTENKNKNRTRYALESSSTNDEKRSDESGVYFERSSPALDQLIKNDEGFQSNDLSYWLHSVDSKRQMENMKILSKVESWLKRCSVCSDCKWMAPKEINEGYRNPSSSSENNKTDNQTFSEIETDQISQSTTSYYSCHASPSPSTFSKNIISRENLTKQPLDVSLDSVAR